MWGDQVNRRQFLGRLFQGIQTYYTCKYGFGMYHNWHQHRPLVNIKVACYYRRTEGEKSGLTSFMKKDLILAIYRIDGDAKELVKCTAYWDSDKLVNTYMSSGCAVYNVPEGKYAVEVLQVGKGIALSKSEVNKTYIDATVYRTTLQNNNYGYVSPAEFNVELIFDISGVYFKPKPKIQTNGSLYPVGPSYSMRYIEYCTDVDQTNDQAVCSANRDLIRHGWSPNINGQQYKLGPIYEVYSDIEAYEFNRIGLSTKIGEVDLYLYPGIGTYEINNICINNNLDFDELYTFDTQQVGEVSYTDYAYERVDMQSKTVHRCMVYNALFNTQQTITSGAGGTEDFDITVLARCNGASMNPSIDSSSVNRLTRRTSTVKNGTRYWGYKYGYLQVRTNTLWDELMVGQRQMIEVKPQVTSHIDLSPDFGIPEKPPHTLFADVAAAFDSMGTEAESLVTVAEGMYINAALANRDLYPSDDTTPWTKTKVSRTVVSKPLPLDIVFGHMTDCYNLIGDDSYPEGTCHYEPMAAKFAISGLLDYDPDHQCNNDNMWMYIDSNIPALFLKQTPTPIDLDSVPDHKIG